MSQETVDSEIRDARFQLDGQHPVTLTVEPDDHREEPLILHGTLVDLSRSGLRITIGQPVPTQRPIRVKFQIQDLGMEFHVGGKVCWTRSDGQAKWQMGCALKPSIPSGLFERLSQQGSIDRRESPRADRDLNIPVYWQLAGQRIDGTLENYSQGGFCVVTNRPGRQGEQLEMKLDGHDMLIVAARCEWHMPLAEGYLIGCSFVSPRGFERLDAYCQALQEAIAS